MDILSWVLGASLYGSGLIVLVIALKAVAGKWMTPQWHYAIWLLVFVRLMLPGGPETDFSMGNMWQLKDVVEVNGERHGKTFFGFLPGGPDGDAAREKAAATGSAAGNHSFFKLEHLLLIVWGIGAATLLVIGGLQAIRVRCLIRNACPVDGEATLALFEDCCTELRIPRRIRLISSIDINYPALAGVMRPVVLIPCTTIESVSKDELRFILAHELMHYRRKDLLAAMAVAPVLALHWFNPLVWFAWYRMRQDREMACDAAVVEIMGKDAAANYGRTLLKLAEQIVPQRRTISGAVGIMEGKSEMGRRIVMLSNYQKLGRAHGWTGALVALMLVAVGYTSAQVKDAGNVDTRATSLGVQMPEIEEIPVDLKNRLLEQREAINENGTATTTATLPLPQFKVPELGLKGGGRPFRVTVAEKDGMLMYNFSKDQSALESIVAEKSVVFSTAETTITAEKLSYTVADETIRGDGPGLTVVLKSNSIVYAADQLLWRLVDDVMTLQGNATVTQTDSHGRITKTTGEVITISPYGENHRARVSMAR